MSPNNKLDEPSCSDQFCNSERFSKPSLSSTNQNHQDHTKTKSKVTNYIVHSIAAAGLLLTAQISLAGSATWLLSPQDSAWENANNWTSGGPPNWPSDIATFAQSSQTSVGISTSVEVNSIVFTSNS